MWLSGQPSGCGGMVDAGDLKSPELCSCGFESRHPHVFAVLLLRCLRTAIQFLGAIHSAEFERFYQLMTSFRPNPPLDARTDREVNMRFVLASCVAIALAGAPAAFAQSADSGAERQTALGIGGLFVRAKDPAALTAWYDKHLGINPDACLSGPRTPPRPPRGTTSILASIPCPPATKTSPGCRRPAPPYSRLCPMPPP